MPNHGALAELTRDAGAVLQMAAPGTEAPAWVLRALEARELGGLVLFSRNLADRAQTAALCASLREADEDVLIALDEEGGDVTRLEIGEGSSYPGNLALGRVDDIRLTESVGRSIGLDLLEVGVNFNYAPCADVNANPDNPVIGVRSFGAESELVARHTAAYIRGLQSVGVIGTAKHFPGHGDASGDSHLGLPMVEYDEALELLHLAPFRSAIEAGTKAIMTSHILFPRYDTQLPATMSPRILTGLLREELGYDGVIVTDGIDMGAISGRYGVAEGTVKAVVAGCDALCWGGSPADEDEYLYLRNALVWAVREGRLSAERLHEAAERNRAVARWSRTVREATAGATADRAVGLEAARRAIAVRSEVKPLTAAPHVAEFSPVVSLAVDDATPWGLAEPLAELLPDTTVEQIPAPTKGTETVGLMVAPVVDQDAQIDLAPLLERAAARPLLLCVRDLHRNLWMRRAVEAVKAARPDAVVVEFGLPHGDLADVLTHGGSRVSGQAAAELLTNRKSEH
ncbi:glycoside hydrolase family 3 protein [Actinospica robiniae]|uniref:glycoside hydrolase family 3 protein n=1 Tax=Actinospica robiniae TaxID=304901 RepID=UPI0003F9B66B|nr:glycoside hydrolase family 3 protein [Actinospica robiniae]